MTTAISKLLHECEENARKQRRENELDAEWEEARCAFAAAYSNGGPCAAAADRLQRAEEALDAYWGNSVDWRK